MTEIPNPYALVDLNLDVHSDIAPSGIDSNLLATGLNDLEKYYRFSKMRLEAIAATGCSYYAATQEFHEYMKTQPEGNGPITPEYAFFRQKVTATQRLVEIEVESYVIFVAMALDRAAVFTEQFLGLTDNAAHRWKSFDSFKRLSDYAAAKGLGEPGRELLNVVAWLREHAVDYRHLYLVHKQEGPDRPRYMVGLSVQMQTGQVSFGVGGVLYPTDDDEPYSSMTADEVAENLDHFLVLWIEYLRSNIV